MVKDWASRHPVRQLCTFIFYAGDASIDACNIQCNANIYVTKKNHCNVGVAWWETTVIKQGSPPLLHLHSWSHPLFLLHTEGH